MYWLKSLEISSMIFLGLCLSGDVAMVLIFTRKSSSSIFLSKSLSCCCEKECFFSFCSFSEVSFLPLSRSFWIIHQNQSFFFPSLISSAVFLIFLSQFSWSGSTKIWIQTFSSLLIFEKADRILSIGSASKDS